MNNRFISVGLGFLLYLSSSLLSVLVLANNEQQNELPVEDLSGLMEKVKKNRQVSMRLYQDREQRFLNDRNQQQQLLDQAEQSFQQWQQKNNPLVAQYEDKAKKIAQMRQELKRLKQDLGDLDQRYVQFAGDFITQMNNSLVSAEFASRQNQLQVLLEQEQLTDLEQLRRLWLYVLDEMHRSSQISHFEAPVVLTDGSQSVEKVTRLGAFVTLFEQQPGQAEYLALNQTSLALPVTQKNDQAKLMSFGAISYRIEQAAQSTLQTLAPSNTDFGHVIIDPSRGSLLGVLQQSPSWLDRAFQGKEVGFMIITLALVGISYGVWRMVVLFVMKLRIQRQLKHLQSVKADNALGRLIMAVSNQTLNQDMLRPFNLGIKNLRYFID